MKVDGSWGSWGSYSTCTVPCGGGVAIRQRNCDSPKPKDGGKYCLGLPTQQRKCNAQPCSGGMRFYRNGGKYFGQISLFLPPSSPYFFLFFIYLLISPPPLGSLSAEIFTLVYRNEISHKLETLQINHGENFLAYNPLTLSPNYLSGSIRFL